MTGRPENRIFWGLGLAVFAIAGMGAIYYTGTAFLIADSARVSHSHSVINTLSDFYAQLQDVRISSRLYVFNTDARFLKHKDAAQTRAVADLQKLDELIRENPGQQDDLAQLHRQFDFKLADTDRLMRLRREAGWLPAVSLIHGQLETDLAGDLRQTVSRMITRERDLLARSALEASHSSRGMMIAVLAGSLAEILVALAAGLAIQRNIRQRQQALDALRESESVLRSFYDSGVIMMGIVELLDEDVRHISDNAAAAKLFGRTPQEICGKTSAELGAPREAIDRWLQAYRQAAATGAPVQFEYQCSLSEDLRWVSCTACSIPTPAGSRPRFSYTMADITERRQAEESLKQHATDLLAAKEAIEQQARTLAANSHQLELARQAADAANQAKSTFLANMSHEIRTPLSAVLGYAELVLEPDQTPSDRHDCLQIIRRSAKHLLELINDILDLSKIEAGRMTVESIPCNPAQMITEVVSMIRPRAQEKGVALNLHFDGPFPEHIKTDPLRLRQVLMNLLGNAIKFTTDGDITVRADCSRNDGGNGVLRIRVTDTGIGMTSEQIAQVFRPFTQADETTTRKFGGTGLGLTISKRLAEMLGGDITISSAVGEGSTFTITVAAGDLSDAHWIHGLSEATFANPAEPSASAVACLRGRILLAEDGKDNQRLISTHLRKAGAEVVLVDNGHDAVRKVEAESFDLVLMDMQMPVMDGYDAAREIRRRGLTIPIIALTAHAMSGDREKCIAAGCTDYLTKPIEKSQLLWTIASHLSDQPAAQIRPPSPPPGASAPAAAEVLKSDFADDADMRQLVDDFVRELPQQVSRVVELLEQNRLEELHRLVHQLKGAGGGYGFGPLSAEAAQAELALKQTRDLDEIERAVHSLVQTIRHIDGYEPSQEVCHASESPDHR